MADQHASRERGDVLVSIGLGSCIGLALVDARRGAAGLAHILLPDSAEGGARVANRGKFADTAVPALLERLARLGSPQTALRAVLVGGAQMFDLARPGGARLDIGLRNERATREALAQAGVRVAAAATHGHTGRTIRVYVGDGRVTVKEAGGAEVPLYQSAALSPRGR